MAEPLPLVSVVTAVRNGAAFLPDLLRSLAAQDHPRIEHVVVDGGSTDGTLELLRGTTGIRWISEPDGGMYDAINKGFRLATGDILAYQNADDRYVAPDALSIAVRVFQARPDVDVVYGAFRYIEEDGRRSDRRPPAPRPFDAAALARYNFVPPHSTFVRSRVVKEGGHWLDAGLQFAGDWDWVLGMARAGHRFEKVDDVLSEFRRHRRSKTSTFGWRPKLAEWRRICDRHGVSFTRLLWYETVYAPMARRLGRVP